ncbi:MAG: DsbA family protein [Candidatus Doudnabacteria bacterium]|nr:DsbA family protein [Candidatus Doudnabacteria bacterium]
MTKEVKIIIVVAALVLLGGAALFMFGNPQPKEAGQAVDSQSLVRENSRMTGKRDAKVTVVEFGDFQCPGCAYADPILKEVIAAYKDNPNFNFVFRNFPLNGIHPNAQVAAEAAEAAGGQGKYWEMHYRIYETQTDWASSQDAKGYFVNLARELGLDVGKFESELNQGIYREIVRTDTADGESIGVNSTPTFFINGVKQTEIPTFEEWKTLIDAELAK